MIRATTNEIFKEIGLLEHLCGLVADMNIRAPRGFNKFGCGPANDGRQLLTK